MRASRLGFTLFEVVISMLVLSVAILATLALLPVGLKAQQLARYQLFASSTALTLMENFHSPLISFRGHGALAPALGTNLANTTPGVPDYSAPPIPGWANRLRDTNLDASPYQHDIERYLAGWVTGVVPLPMDIARRLDSDGDQIQRHLDQGGYLFYLDPGYVRGLTVAAARGKAITLNPSPESQKLVFAVTGYAQQNALTSHPVESWPWYELYPFPPEWVALKAHGYEIRRGPVLEFPDGMPVEGQDMWGEAVGVSSGSEGAGADKHSVWTGGIIWGDGGPSGWQPVTFEPAPMNQRHLNPPASTRPPYQPTDQTVNRIDPLDPTINATDPAKSETVGWYQGRNWRYFAAHADAGSPWAAGWPYFQRLAGFNDTYRDLSWNDYAALPKEQHYERAGWLPVMAMLNNDGDARYDAYWYEILGDPAAGAGKVRYRGGESLGTMAQVGTGVFPPKPDSWAAGVLMAKPWLSGDQYNYGTRTGAPHSLLLPTYEMRASYRDKALELWYAVSQNITAFAGAPLTRGTSQPVTDTQEDCDEYEYGPTEMEKFITSAESVLDPHQLKAGEFPPHPAQVLALSYLAHAAMLMTGWEPPFQSPEMRNLLDWDSLTWHYSTANPAAGPGQPTTTEHVKDAKLLAADAGAGNPSFLMTNDSKDREIVLYAGDEICFEEDYRDWYAHTNPGPAPYASGSQKFAAPPARGVTKYRVKTNVVIGANASGTVEIEPALARAYYAQVTNGPHAPGTQAGPGADTHPQQIVRICSEKDRAFARTVHEMCMRWAACYCSENPYDWGAPRMMNHQVMSDKPLAMFDLFEDAAVGASSNGNAQRNPQHLPTSSTVSPQESFYRWIQTPNTAPRSWFRKGLTQPTGPVCAISDLGPERHSDTAWQSLMYNAQLAPPSTPNASGPWNWSSDANRYWLNRPFQPFHRGRELVFWAVDWRSYEDAETAPSAPLDLAKHARSIRLKPDGTTVDWFYPMILGTNGARTDSQFAGNPENAVLWTGPDHQRRFIDDKTDYYFIAYWAYDTECSDLVLGHWGADRNNNRTLDVGPVPKSARMHATTVARFNVYDPVLRVHDSD